MGWVGPCLSVPALEPGWLDTRAFTLSHQAAHATELQAALHCGDAGQKGASLPEGQGPGVPEDAWRTWHWQLRTDLGWACAGT